MVTGLEELKDFSVQVGDIVTVVDSTARPGSWSLEDILPDPKGLGRSVKIKTKTRVNERPCD